MSFLSSLSSGLGSGLASGITNAIFGGSQMRKQRRQQQILMDHQAKIQKDLYQFERQAENEDYEKYQTASAQRAQLEAAGLNPGLMYSGSGGGSIASSLSSHSMGSAGLGSVSAPSLQVQSDAQAIAAYERNPSIIERNKAENEAATEQAKLLKMEAQQKQWEYDFLNEFRLAEAEYNAKAAEHNANKARSEADLSQLNANLFQATFADKLEESYYRWLSAKETYNNLVEDTKLKKVTQNQLEKLARYYDEAAGEALSNAKLNGKRFDIWEKTGIDPNTVKATGMYGALFSAAQLMLQNPQTTLNHILDRFAPEWMPGQRMNREILTKFFNSFKPYVERGGVLIQNPGGPGVNAGVSSGFGNSYADLGRAAQIK